MVSPAYGDIVYRFTSKQLAAMYPGLFYYKGPQSENKIALTFDDGPDDRTTPKILDILKENNVKATFFLVGKHAQQYPGMVKRIVLDGNIIANHTWSHRNLSRLNQTEIEKELERTQQLLEEITGLKTALIRPPWGAVSESTMQVLKKKGYRTINWSADSFDWRDTSTRKIIANLAPHIFPGTIILMHSISPNKSEVTVRTLPTLIRMLKAQGYEFTTLDKLLHVPAYK